MVSDYMILDCYKWEENNLATLIKIAVKRLPEEIQIFFIDKCRILSIGRANFGVTYKRNILLEEKD